MAATMEIPVELEVMRKRYETIKVREARQWEIFHKFGRPDLHQVVKNTIAGDLDVFRWVRTARGRDGRRMSVAVEITFKGKVAYLKKLTAPYYTDSYNPADEKVCVRTAAGETIDRDTANKERALFDNRRHELQTFYNNIRYPNTKKTDIINMLGSPSEEYERTKDHYGRFTVCEWTESCILGDTVRITVIFDREDVLAKKWSE